MVNSISDDYELPPLLTVQQLADLLQLSTRTVWRLRSAGKLPHPIEIGGSVRWNGEEVGQWIAAGCPNPIPSKRR